MKKIIIFHNLRQFKTYNDLKKGLGVNLSTQIIALDLDLIIYLKNKNIQHKTLEEYISDKDADEIDYAAFDLAENWHRDFIKFNEISLGRLIQWDLKYYFARIIRNFQAILKILEIESPNEIITFKEKDYFIREFIDILYYICSLKKISINIIPLTAFSISPHKSKLCLINLILRNTTIFLSLTPISKIFKFLSSLIVSLKILKLSEKKEKKKILMIGGYTFPSLVDEISKNNLVFNLFRRRTLVSIRKNVMDVFRGKKSRFYIYLEDYKQKKIREQSILFIKNSLNHWKKIIKTPKFKEIFILKGLSIWPLVKKKIYEQIFLNFEGAVENILAFNKFLRRHRFDLITFDVDTMEFQKTLAFVASQLNVPTMVIQHGLAGSQNQIDSKIYTIGFIPLSADKIAVWGKAAKNWFVHHGISERRVIITGAPRFDKYIIMNRNNTLKLKIKKSVYQHFGIKREKNLILFTPNNQDFNIRFTSLHLALLETENIYKCILNAIKEIPNSHLIIKLHPNDHYEYISSILIKNLGIENVSVVRKYNIEHLLISCDCQITTWSTTGLEGLLFGNPLICIKFRNRKYDVPYIEYDVAYEVSKCEDLPSTIKKVLNNPSALKINYKKFLEDFNFKIDGLATKRIAKLIEDLCKK